MALTAYAIRFLTDAKDVIEIDKGVLDKAREFLIKKQRANGSWDIGEEKQNLLITAYIARILAVSMKEAFQGNEKDTKAKSEALNESVKHSLIFLRSLIDSTDEPQLLALYALTATEIKDTNEAERINKRLEKLALNEGTGSYWALELNTPFYGWGLAGRIETTALVVQSLSMTSKNKDLVNRGLLFLLKQKDRYGVWYSTQATINVLDALTSLLSNNESGSNDTHVSIFVNGNLVKTVSLTSNDLITINVSDFMKTGDNSIEVKLSDKSSPSSAQLVTSYYSTWQSKDTESINRNNSSALRFSVNYAEDRTHLSKQLI